jgi:histone acetyltransferase
MMLVDAMNIFSRQLPNMGTPYIARLVFDVGGISVILLNGGRAAGGICSKVFQKEAFLEIVFCAVESQFQSRGFARLMMNYLKMYLQALEIYDILTCADNEAVTYFRKQGFNKHEILMDLQRWEKYR